MDIVPCYGTQHSLGIFQIPKGIVSDPAIGGTCPALMAGMKHSFVACVCWPVMLLSWAWSWVYPMIYPMSIAWTQLIWPSDTHSA
ncbi:MAG: prominin family protein [Elusimicrobia bacterium]|nr:prominin family protein [Elusimicrobiota bacterium]